MCHMWEVLGHGRKMTVNSIGEMVQYDEANITDGDASFVFHFQGRSTSKESIFNFVNFVNSKCRFRVLIWVVNSRPQLHPASLII